MHDACMQPLYNGKDGSFVFAETTIERHRSYNLSLSLFPSHALVFDTVRGLDHPRRPPREVQALFLIRNGSREQRGCSRVRIFDRSTFFRVGDIFRALAFPRIFSFFERAKDKDTMIFKSLDSTLD